MAKYKWYGMTKITYDEALEMYKLGQCVYLLYDDNTEAMCESKEDLNKHNDDGGEFGFENGGKTNITITDMLIQCIDLDIQCMGEEENGFKSVSEVLDFYRGISHLKLTQIYIGYYGDGTEETILTMDDIANDTDVLVGDPNDCDFINDVGMALTGFENEDDNGEVEVLIRYKRKGE